MKRIKIIDRSGESKVCESAHSIVEQIKIHCLMDIVDLFASSVFPSQLPKTYKYAEFIASKSSSAASSSGATVEDEEEDLHVIGEEE